MDISFHVDNIYQKNRKLVVFDMDSTLIQSEVIVALAELAGAGPEAEQITRSAMQGEMDFKESFRRRVALLKGLAQPDLEHILQTLPLTEGAQMVTATLKRLGYKLGILSGGFTFVGNYLKEKLGFDYMYANELDMEDGVVTGRVKGEIVDGEKKPYCCGKSPRRKICPFNRPLPSATGPMTFHDLHCRVRRGVQCQTRGEKRSGQCHLHYRAGRAVVLDGAS